MTRAPSHAGADDGAPDAVADAGLEAALRRAVTPLLRLAVRRGLGLRRIMEIVKDAMVEVATQECDAAGAPATDSRLSIMTGVHRKDVRARRLAPRPARPTRNLASTVIGRWLGDPAWAGRDGRPRALARGEGVPDGFDALVAGISRDVRPRTVLDELVRLGAVALDADGAVRLTDAAFTPVDDAARLSLFAANLGDHASAAVDNLTAAADAPRRLERAVFYNRLRPTDVAALTAQARAQGQALLEALNGEALRRQRRGAGAEDATRRFRLGVYVYDEDEAPRQARGATSNWQEEGT